MVCASSATDGSIVELKEALPLATNNVAEYSGLLAALRWAVAHGVTTLHVRSDSLLLVKQMNGQYRVKNPGLQPLYEDARSLVRQIGRVTFEHVRREFNKEADRLANEAMDEARRVTYAADRRTVSRPRPDHAGNPAGVFFFRAIRRQHVEVHRGAQPRQWICPSGTPASIS